MPNRFAKIVQLIPMLLIAGWETSPDVFACRYNVRDVGFVDLDPQPAYRFHIYMDEETASHTVSTVEQISYAVFLDSNIEVELTRVAQSENGPKPELLEKHDITSLPAAVLTSPEGQSLPLSIPSESSFQQSIWDVLDDISSSPARESILEHIVKSYAVVMLVEGPNADTNAKAEQAAENAIRRISAMLGQLPKEIDRAPRLIRIHRDSAEEEHVLLWSLGITTLPPSEPYAAVLYGRGRRMGPVLAGKQITERSIFKILSVVGLSCECGLERSWMQGTMLPLRWDEERQSEAVKYLGFDPESPLVKTEISQILSMGSSFGDTPNLGYREGLVELEGNTDMIALPEALPAPTDNKDETGRPSSVFGGLLFFILLISVFALGGGILILVQAKSKL